MGQVIETALDAVGREQIAGDKQASIASKGAYSSSASEARKKVVIRFATGRLLRGFLTFRNEAVLQRNKAETFVVEKANGQQVEVRTSEIKAIFTVKSFEGKPNYSEFKVFSSQPDGRGIWVRVHFQDGERMEGVAPNCLNTYSREVFFMKPPDPASNNQAVLVSKHFLKEVQVLDLASD